MKQREVKYIYGLVASVVMLIAFNNCGEGFVTRTVAGAGNAVFFSRAPGESCEDALMDVYKSTYHPFLNQTCNNCHINGPGIGVFASPDLKTSFDSFMTTGVTKISGHAVDPTHKPPYTGTQNTARINEITSYWTPAQNAYASCVAADSGSGGAATTAIKTAGKAVPANLGTTTFVRMEWDLETLTSAKLPLIAGIEVRLGAVAGVTKGYEFRNPTLRLKALTSGPYYARALNIYMNNELQSEVTTYSNMEATVSTTTDLNLSPATANAFDVYTVAATNMVSLEFSVLKSTTGSTTVGSTPTPTPTPVTSATPTQVTFTQLVAAGGIFANSCVSCHSANSAAGGLNLTSYTAAAAAAQNIKSRVNNAANPMPTGGLLSQTQRDIISSWVDRGAPQ